MLTDK
jgi:hypothetical protein